MGSMFFEGLLYILRSVFVLGVGVWSRGFCHQTHDGRHMTRLKSIVYISSIYTHIYLWSMLKV
jgi:hypothetical protein